MQSTIDKAGRVVIPAELRRQAGLLPGTPIAATFENGAVQLKKDVPAPELQRHRGRLIAKPRYTSGEAINLAQCVEEERNRHS